MSYGTDGYGQDYHGGTDSTATGQHLAVTSDGANVTTPTTTASASGQTVAVGATSAGVESERSDDYGDAGFGEGPYGGYDETELEDYGQGGFGEGLYGGEDDPIAIDEGWGDDGWDEGPWGTEEQGGTDIRLSGYGTAIGTGSGRLRVESTITPAPSDEDKFGFNYGGDGATLGGRDGARWSPEQEARGYWRIDGRRVEATSLEISYDSVSIDFQLPAIEIGPWRDQYQTAGDIDTVVGTAGRFRQFPRDDETSDTLRVQLRPQESLTPTPLNPIEALVLDYSDDPIANGDRYEVSMEFGRVRNAGPDDVGDPQYDPDPRNPPEPTYQATWGAGDWGDGEWGDTEVTSDSDTETQTQTQLLADGGDPEYITGSDSDTDDSDDDTADAEEAGTRTTTTRPRTIKAQAARTRQSTTASVTGGTVSDYDIETVASDTDAVESESDLDADAIDDQYDISDEIDPDPDDWIIQWPSGDVFVLDNRHILPPAESASALREREMSVMLDDDQAKTMLEVPTYLDAVTEFDIPDGNNIAFDGAAGRNTCYVTPPVDSEFVDGQYVVTGWSVEPWAITEWTADLSLQPAPDLGREVLDVDGFGLSSFGLDPFGQ